MNDTGPTIQPISVGELAEILQEDTLEDGFGRYGELLEERKSDDKRGAEEDEDSG